jgi:hypothetical protein
MIITSLNKLESKEFLKLNYILGEKRKDLKILEIKKLIWKMWLNSSMFTSLDMKCKWFFSDDISMITAKDEDKVYLSYLEEEDRNVL